MSAVRHLASGDKSTLTKSGVRSRGPKLGVAKSRKVTTAGGRVGQWWTPPWLATLFAEWCGITPGMRVLDAGAGMGALTTAARARGAHVTAVEVDSKLVARLVTRFAEDEIVAVREMDFLARDPRQMLLPVPHLDAFELVISNPVWEGDVPEKFILRSLELSERVCLIVPLNLQCGGRRKGLWDTVEVTRMKALPHRPRFLGAKGGMRDVMLLECRRRLRSLPGPHTCLLEVG